MVTAPCFRFPVLSLLSILTLVSGSCGEDEGAVHEDSTPAIVYLTGTQEIGSTGYVIDLADGFYLKDDPDAFAFYYEPTHSDANNSGGGIYFGSSPDTTSPGTEYTERKFTNLFLGDTVPCREFSARDYWYRELMYTQKNGEFIHSWCYSKDSLETERLWQSVKSVRKK